MNLKRKLQRLFLISLAGWSFGDGAARAATVFDVSIGDNFFLPSSVTVFAGDQVKWTWVGVNSHSTTSDAGLWDSGVGGNGMTYARTFSSAGSFPYHCTIHSFQLGSVTVNAGGPAVTIVNPANGAVFSAPARFTLTATTTDPNGAVTNVAFLRGATVLANETHAPYSVVVSNLATGTYNFSAVATDNRNRRATNTISVRVIADVVRPTLTFVSPVAGQRVTNTTANVTVIGKTADNVRVTNAQIQLNGGDWVRVTTANSFANWTAIVAPTAGTNVLRAFATDSNGNNSLTNRLSFSYVVTSPLTLITNGTGGIARTFKGTLLEVGRAYTVTAVPGTGQVFSNWVSDSFVSKDPVLQFIMKSNLVIQANFIPNPFLPAQGLYRGLFAEPVRAHERSGFFALTLADHGAYSASLKRGTNVYPFSGQFKLSGTTSKSVNGWLVNMTLDLAGAEKLSGTVSGTDWVADLVANRYVFNALTNPATAFKGAYTLIVPGSANLAAVPAGHGFGAVTVAPSGMLTLNGTLADNTAWSQSVPLSSDGQWACYVPLYGGQGSAWGWLLFDTSQPAAQINGDLSWIRPPRRGATYYPLGFTNDALAQGSRYVAPTNSTTRVIDVTNGIVIFDGGNLAATFTNQLTLTPSNRVINSGPNSFSMSITRSNGVFSGSVKVPGTTRTNTFKGAFLQDLESGYGFFLGTNQSGSVFIGAP